MSYIEISRFFTIVASAIITFGLYDQVIKIWRTKSAEDFTFLLLIALFINEIAWLNYGFALNEWPIILLGSINIPAIILAIIGYVKYGWRKKN